MVVINWSIACHCVALAMPHIPKISPVYGTLITQSPAALPATTSSIYEIFAQHLIDILGPLTCGGEMTNANIETILVTNFHSNIWQQNIVTVTYVIVVQESYTMGFNYS